MVYGPNVNAAAILLGSEGNVPIERTAMLMQALLGTPVSVGFVARALARLAERLTAADHLTLPRPDGQPPDHREVGPDLQPG